MNKKALILSAGGVTGAWEVGVIKYLVEQGQQFDIICGSSVGTLNAAFLSQYNKEDIKTAIKDLEDFWLNLKQKHVYKSWFPFGRLQALWKSSLYNSEPLHELIKSTIDLDKLNKSNIEFKFGTVSVNTGNYCVYSKNNLWLHKLITASASCPPFFFPVNIIGDVYEYDSGLREYTPLNLTIQSGATEIIAITTDNAALMIADPKKLKTFDLMKRSISILVSELIRNDFDTLQRINREVLNGTNKDKTYIDCKLYMPQEFLTNNSMVFDHKTIERLIEIGYNNAKGDPNSK